MNRFCAPLTALLLALALANCHSPRLELRATDSAYAQLGPCALNGRGLSRTTAQALERASAPPPVSDAQSVRVGNSLDLYAEQNPRDLAVQQALMEKDVGEARQREATSREEALVLYLRAAERAAPLLASYSPEEWPFLYQLNQFATARVVERLDLSTEEKPKREFRGANKTYRLSVATVESGSRINPFRFHSLIAADSVRVRGFSKHVKQAGLGAPFIGGLDAPPDLQAHPFFPRTGLFQPLCALLHFDGDRVSLVFHDLRRTSALRLSDGRELPLAADYSAAWARQTDASPDRIAILGMLRPEKVRATMGLTLAEPFRPDAIPVVLVHGLASSDATWDETINGLLDDRRIRERCQFWLYQYPSGYPFFYPAMELRRALREARAHFDPAGRLAVMDQMVLVGHSMGGLISSAQIRQADEKALNAFFKRPLNAQAVDEKAKKQLRELLFFDPVGSIRRVVFVATPHRGSTLADGWIGRLISRLIELPNDLITLNVGGIMQEITDTGLSLIDLAPNSVTRLQYYNPMLTTLEGLPVDSRVQFHSIVGDRGLGNAPNSSDGVVSYASSHLDKAQSEKVVPAWHSAHRHPEAIDELRRILWLHLDSF